MLCVVPPVSLGAVRPPQSGLSSSYRHQVFYGRYLRKLSNLTQEAIGEMSKVIASDDMLMLCLMICLDRRGEVKCVQDGRRVQFAAPRDPPVLSPGGRSLQLG